MWESHWLTNMGEEHRKLEEALKERLRTPNVCLFTNGHNALECILEALGLHGEVVTTPFSFASTTHARARPTLLHERASRPSSPTSASRTAPSTPSA